MQREERNVSGTYLSVPKGEGRSLVADPDREGFRDLGGSKAAVIGDGGGRYVTLSTARRGLSFKRTKITRGRG